MLVPCLAWLALAGTPGSLHARLDAMREQVRQNRDLEDEQRALLEAKLAGVDSALSAFEQTAAKGEERQRQMQPLMVAGTALLADDVTGVGTADDVLLPIVALVAVLVQLRTQAPASDQELQAALSRLESAIDAAIQAGQAVLMSQQEGIKIRGLAGQIAQTLARMLGRDVGGKPPDHQEDPKRDRRHWWVEIMAAFKPLQKKRLSPRQWADRLKDRFTPAQQAEIREAFNEAAKLMGEKPPNWPPPVTP